MVDNDNGPIFEAQRPEVARVADALGGITVMGELEMAEARPSDVVSARLVDGLGDGEGSISFAGRRESVGAERIAAAEAVITSDDILVPISTDSDGNVIEDDGCGDGREVGAVLDGHEEVDKPSLDRAKVFGGGATMGTAARIAVDGMTAPTLNEEFAQTMDVLDDKLIGYGAHTDSHAVAGRGSARP